MSTLMVKTSVSVPRAELAAAQALGINISELVRSALRRRLREESLQQEVDGYGVAFAEWDNTKWDALTGDGLGPMDER